MTFNFLDEVFKRLIEDKEIKFYLTSRQNRIIPFPLVFRRMGVLWHFSKEDSIRILRELEKRKLIKIVNFHGIKLVQNLLKFHDNVLSIINQIKPSYR